MSCIISDNFPFLSRFYKSSAAYLLDFEDHKECVLWRPVRKREFLLDEEFNLSSNFQSLFQSRLLSVSPLSGLECFLFLDFPILLLRIPIFCWGYKFFCNTVREVLRICTKKWAENGRFLMKSKRAGIITFLHKISCGNVVVMGHRCRNIENIDVCFRLSMFFTSIPPNRCRCVKYRYQVSISMFLFSL